VHAVIVTVSASFLKKIGSRRHSDPKFGRRGGGVSHIDPRGKSFRMPFQLQSSERTSGTVFWHKNIPGNGA
jgi:hypothetical protein